MVCYYVADGVIAVSAAKLGGPEVSGVFTIFIQRLLAVVTKQRQGIVINPQAEVLKQHYAPMSIRYLGGRSGMSLEESGGGAVSKSKAAHPATSPSSGVGGGAGDLLPQVIGLKLLCPVVFPHPI